MASLRDQFEPCYTPSADAIDAALRAGLVTPDTNVLLSLYRLQPLARDELFRVLAQLGDQLWIPHQVALEFHQNRLNVIAEQERFFGKIREDLEAAATDYIKKFRTFSNRIALPDITVQKLIDGIQDANAAVNAEVSSAEQANEIHLDSLNSDEVLARLEALFNDRIGDPMDTTELEEARKEARRRIEAKIPPGYMDRGKTDPAGDYILWKQLIQEAAKRRAPVVLITDDRKEDWFRREHGLTLGPRIRLTEERKEEANVSLFLMTTETFLIQAKEHLSAPVSSATVSQAKELPVSIIEEHHRARMEEELLMLENMRDLEMRRAAVQHQLSDAAQHRAQAEATFAEYNRLQSENPDGPEGQRTGVSNVDPKLAIGELDSARLQMLMLQEEAAMLDASLREVGRRLQSLANRRVSEA